MPVTIHQRVDSAMKPPVLGSIFRVQQLWIVRQRMAFTGKGLPFPYTSPLHADSRPEAVP
jgi:hypothetical protein